MMFLVIGAVLLVATFLIGVGLVSLIFIRHPNTSVSTPTVKDLPHELALCDNFKPGTIVLLDLGKGEKHFQVTGDCPLSTLALRDVYVAQLEYLGWTVHDDGSGNLTCYSYGRKEALNAGLSDSSNTANQSTLSVELVTGVTSPPDGFPPVKSTPSGSAGSVPPAAPVGQLPAATSASPSVSLPS
jgi:hypothetical protein